MVSPCEIGAVILRFITDQLRTVTSTYDPADACVRAASTYPYLSAADVTQRKRLCDWGIRYLGYSGGRKTSAELLQLHKPSNINKGQNGHEQRLNPEPVLYKFTGDCNQTCLRLC